MQDSHQLEGLEGWWLRIRPVSDQQIEKDLAVLHQESQLVCGPAETRREVVPEEDGIVPDRTRQGIRSELAVIDRRGTYQGKDPGRARGTRALRYDAADLAIMLGGVGAAGRSMVLR